MRVRHSLPLLTASALLCSLSCLKAETNGMTEFLKTKYGFFVHYVWGGDQKKSLTVGRAGKPLASFDEFANAFDAPGFATDLESWGVEYVILTAWHYNINPLFPSETMKKWGMENHTCKRDLLRDAITACKAKGIRVMLYTHPRDGHDLAHEDQVKTGWGGLNGTDPDWSKFDRTKWNDFTNELYQELIARYGNDIIGIFSDEGSAAGDSWRVVDYPRLRQTVKALQPDLMMEQNFYGTTYSLDVGCKEYAYWGEFANRDGNAWPAWRMPVATIFAPSWYATKAAGENVAAFKPEDMFRYTILQAGANHEGGGVQWAAGNYAGGGWETGVEETMDKVAGYIKPIAPAIKNVFASTSWPTAPGTKLPDLKWGVATRATDGKTEYLHILTPPTDGSKTLTLPPPADGKKFEKAVLLASKKPVALKQNESGLHLKLPDGDSWDKLDTVIALKVAADSPLQNLALWKAFRGSSFPDPTSKAASAYAFYAVDGDPATAWSSRLDGVTEGNQPVPADSMPACQIDLGKSAKLSRIEVLGQLGAGVGVSVSSSADFKKAETLATSAPSEQATLEIKKATYGKDGQVADITEKARQSVVSGSLSLKAGNDLANGDPAPNQLKELRIEFALNGKDEVKVVPEGESISLGGFKPLVIEVPAGTTAQFIRLARTQNGPPLRVNEFRVIGKFE
jgi:hypothetical protein